MGRGQWEWGEKGAVCPPGDPAVEPLVARWPGSGWPGGGGSFPSRLWGAKVARCGRGGDACAASERPGSWPAPFQELT